jgi:predicted amidophosphoribosyltransferase
VLLTTSGVGQSKRLTLTGRQISAIIHVMSVMEYAIGLLAPVECINCGSEGDTFCDGCSATEILPFGERCFICNKLSSNSRSCPSCRPHSPSYVWITTEYSGLAMDLVKKLKFHHLRRAAKPIARMMAETLLAVMGPGQLNKKHYLIIPVPTATSRVRQRSFDHAQAVASALAGNLKADTATTLKRLGHSRQVGAKREVRAIGFN